MSDVELIIYIFFLFSKDLTAHDAAWKRVRLPDTTPGRRRNVARLRAMGGDPTCVPPDFNRSMLAIWEELWHSMPQSGKIGVLVNSLLKKYKEHCGTLRKQPRHLPESPPALLPVSFAQAKDWLLKQQKAQSEPLQAGVVNEEAREVVADLNRSLAEQPVSTAALLEQPAHLATPVVPPPVMSLGPEPVTDRSREEERADQRARRQAEEPCTASQRKKKKAIPPEVEERQKRASARMIQRGIPPLQVRIYFLHLEACYLFTFIYLRAQYMYFTVWKYSVFNI